jgi:Na+-translocating ferredoxin:NAD+ oxidoreductase RnfC subunit
MQAAPLAPKEVVLPFKQSAGAPGRPVARAGQPVAAGQVLTEVPEGTLGVPVHAPFGAVVTALGEDHFVLRRAS